MIVSHASRGYMQCGMHLESLWRWVQGDASGGNHQPTDGDCGRRNCLSIPFNLAMGAFLHGYFWGVHIYWGWLLAGEDSLQLEQTYYADYLACNQGVVPKSSESSFRKS